MPLDKYKQGETLSSCPHFIISSFHNSSVSSVGLGLPPCEHKRGEAPPEQVPDRGAHGCQGDHQVRHLKDGNACEAQF